MPHDVTTCLRREPGKLIVEIHIISKTEWSTNPDMDARLREDHRTIAKAMHRAKPKGKLGKALVEFVVRLVTTKTKPTAPVKHITYKNSEGRPQAEQVM
jgi:hypothetical protein